ncbi:unnamed protein product [Ectocarpus sp. 12 AP-2014]
MSVREVSSAEFYQLSRRTEGKLLVTQFTATWCGPCRRIAPQYEALARRMPEVEFVKVYEHNSRDAIIASGVRSFPTFHFYLGGAKVDECRGANIANVEQKANQHQAAASSAGGPVMVKLRFEREKPRENGEGFILVAQETDVEVHASEGLEIFKFQVLSLTDIEAEEQSLAAGDSNTPIDSDADLTAALRKAGGGVYGNYPVIRVSKRSKVARGGASAGRASAGTAAGATASKVDWEGCCSRTFFGGRAVIQPAYVIREETLLPEGDLSPLQKKKAGPEAILLVCKACAENCFVPGRAGPSAAISTAAAFVCQSKEACGKGYGSDLFSGRADAGVEVLPPGSPAAVAAEAAAAAAADKVYYAARGLPPATTNNSDNSEMADMRRQIASGMRGALAYEDGALQAKARAVLPTEGGSVVEKGAEMAAAGGFSEEEGLARALLSWFKKDFFKWTNKPPCSGCGARGACMQGKGGCAPTPEEASSKASVVELYVCKECGAETRYPRYNDPAKLLETRNGRCGEWANCFTLMCRAVGLEARCARDWTDHVWTEIWIPARNAWVHADACENKLDKPLMYEQGWNKRLSYVVAFGKDGAVDVTRRYTRRWLQVLSRRNLVPETWLAGIIGSHSATRTGTIVARLAEEQRELERYESMRCDGDGLDSEEKEGRLSGDAEWIAARGEGGGPAGAAGGSPRTAAAAAASPFTGVPMASLQPGGGLALCVAAVVERSGDASVLVGGTTVCRLSEGGRGHRGAVCVAAVSATTGVLLGANTFVLGTEADSAAEAWLDGQPDGAVVAVAAAGGGQSKEQAGLGAGLTEAMLAQLFGEGSPDTDADDGKSKPSDDESTSTAIAVVGFKKGPTGARRWARRQHRGEDGGGGRCALYAEILLPPPASGRAAAVQVELQDKLSLCPLRSLPAEGDAAAATTTPSAAAGSAPARGTCRRAGEPTVSVGPAVDLVDCPGWTTVLQVPGDMAGVASADDAGNEEVSAVPPVGWVVTTVHPAVGGTHEDTEEFDDGPVGCPAFVMGGSPVALTADGSAPPFLPAGRVREIVGWSGDAVNGVQVVYDVQGDAVRGPKRMGDHGLYRQSNFVLDVEGGEVLTEISVKAGAIVDSLRVRTNKGREKTWGGAGGHLQRTWHVPTGSSFLGFHGGVGGHVHSLGVTLAERGGQAAGASGESSLALDPVVKTNLYAADRVARACAQFLAFNAPPPGGGKAGRSAAASSPALRTPPPPPPAPQESMTTHETIRQ